MDEEYKVPMKKLNILNNIRDNKYIAVAVCIITVLSWTLVSVFEHTYAQLYLCYIRQASFGYWMLFCWLNYKAYWKKQRPDEKIEVNKLWPWIKNNKTSLILTVLFPLILVLDAVIYSLMFLVPTGIAFSFISTIWCFYWFIHLYII